MEAKFRHGFRHLPFWLVLATGVSVANAGTIVSDFRGSLDGWQPQWHIDSQSGTAGTVSLSPTRGFMDSASLHFDMGDGLGDDGTLWIEKQFEVPIGVPSPVVVSFQLFNEFQSDFNNFQVKAAIRENNPQQQGDFATIGYTGSAEGWVPFDYEQTVTSESGQVWVALGVRVAWETHRDYWIDHVAVTTPVVPEPSSVALVGVGLITVAASGIAHGARAKPR